MLLKVHLGVQLGPRLIKVQLVPLGTSQTMQCETGPIKAHEACILHLDSRHTICALLLNICLLQLQLLISLNLIIFLFTATVRDLQSHSPPPSLCLSCKTLQFCRYLQMFMATSSMFVFMCNLELFVYD